MSWSVSFCGTPLEDRAKFIEELGGTTTIGKIGEIEVFYSKEDLLAACCTLFGKTIIMWEEDGGREPWMDYNEQDGKYYPAGDGESVIVNFHMEVRE